MGSIFILIGLAILTQVFGNIRNLKSEIEPPQNSGQQTNDYNQVRYDSDTSTLRTIGDDCGGNMRFFASPDNEKSGTCDCDYLKCSRPFIYDIESKKCHPAWSRGPCSEGEWFVYGPNFEPKCEKADPCKPSGEDESQFYFKRPEDGKCYQHMTRGYCRSRDETLMTYPGQPIPICRRESKCYPLSVPLQQICAPANRRTVEGYCNN